MGLVLVACPSPLLPTHFIHSAPPFVLLRISRFGKSINLTFTSEVHPEL